MVTSCVSWLGTEGAPAEEYATTRRRYTVFARRPVMVVHVDMPV